MTKSDYPCVACQNYYDVNDIYRNYGSNYQQKCWPCLKLWVDQREADPYRVGAGHMRNESPRHISDDLAARFKEAFELTQKMIDR